MSGIAVVTDSTSDLPESICAKYQIKIVPLSVLFADKIYLDNGKSIKQDDFYKMMEKSDQMPKAAIPSPGDFLKAYTELLEKGKEIISLHISSKLSGTLNSAELARKQLDSKKIHVLDSQMVHMPCGFMAMKAAMMANKNHTASDIIEELDHFRGKIYSLFVPKSLDNLIKGGRISKMKATFANLLEIKPILTLKDGEVCIYKKTKKWEIAKKELVDSLERSIKKNRKLTVSIGDVASDKEASELESTIKDRFAPFEVIRVKIGIVVGSHLGIGGLGVSFFSE
jgi:DegV family protein with EDD domain